jgi:hypothetical protein
MISIHPLPLPVSFQASTKMDEEDLDEGVSLRFHQQQPNTYSDFF